MRAPQTPAGSGGTVHETSLLTATAWAHGADRTVPGLIPERQCTLYGTAAWERLTPHGRLALRHLEAASVAETARRLAGGQRLPWLDGLRDTAGAAHCGAVLLGQELTHAYLAGRATDRPPEVGTAPRAWADRGDVARAELLRAVATVSPARLRQQRLLLARTALALSRSLADPAAYAQVGLDPRAAARAALANPYHQEAVCRAGERPLAFLREAGLIGTPGLRWWRRSFLLR